jgi:hypothetical protein
MSTMLSHKKIYLQQLVAVLLLKLDLESCLKSILATINFALS